MVRGTSLPSASLHARDRFAPLIAQRGAVTLRLEDAVGVSERPNVPGTTTEFPNWRLALPHSLEEIEKAAGPRRIGAVMKRARRNLSPTS